MSTSSFSPWLVKLTLNSVSGPYGIRLASSGSSVRSPTCDGVEPGAVQAGRGLAAVRAGCRRPTAAGRARRRPWRARATRCPGRNCALLEPLARRRRRPQRVLDQRDHALRCRSTSEVEEHLHRAGDLVDRPVGRLGVGAERRADLARRSARARRGASPSRSGTSAAPRSCRPACRAPWPARTAAPPGPCSRRPGSTGRRRARVAQEVEERLADLAVGVAHDRGDLAVVVLERVLLARSCGSR